MERVIGYGNPSLFGHLGRGVQAFIDGTFRIVPHPFYQVLIIMIYCSEVEVYVPVLYILMTCKTEWAYRHALHETYVVSRYKFHPFSVTCDFEKGLHNAVRFQYDSAIINGCLFHWKQALRKKMSKLKIKKEQMTLAMEIGNIDVMTVIPRYEILTKGMFFVKDIIQAEGDLDDDDIKKWDLFWIYFKSFWCKTPEFIESWNIRDEDDAFWELQNRTNNGLEQYNRTLNSKFPSTHPQPIVFVKVLEAEAIIQVDRLEGIRRKHIVPYPHLELTIKMPTSKY